LARSEALRVLKHNEEALSEFNSALQRQSDNAAAFRGAIQCCYALDRKEEAKRLIDQGRSVLPENQQLRELELTHEIHYGEPEKILATVEDDLAKHPEDRNTLARAARAYLAAGNRRLKSKPDDSADAMAFLSKARELFSQGIAKW